MARITLGPRGRNAYVMTRRTIGDDTTLTEAVGQPIPQAVDSSILESLNKRTDEIMKRLDEDARARKYALMIGAASALFAAVKLGFIAFPAIRSRVKSTP